MVFVGPFGVIRFGDLVPSFLADPMFIHPPNVSTRVALMVFSQHAFWQANRHGPQSVTVLAYGIHVSLYGLIKAFPVRRFKARESHVWHKRPIHAIVEIRRPLAYECDP